MTTPRNLDQRQLAGPFDIVGVVRGGVDELGELLARLGHPPLRPQVLPNGDATLQRMILSIGSA